MTGYSAVLSSQTPEAIEGFCDWIRGQPDSFEEIALTAADQVFRFKVRSRKRRTGMVCKKAGKFLLVGPAAFHFDRFQSTWGTTLVGDRKPDQLAPCQIEPIFSVKD